MITNILLRINKQHAVLQLIRYGIVGIVCNLIGYAIYLLITQSGLSPKTAMSILYLLSATISFWGNRQYTFAHQGNQLGAGARYFIVHCIGYLINLSILVVMVDILEFAHQWVQAMAIFIVAGFLFLALKFFVFRTPDHAIQHTE